MQKKFKYVIIFSVIIMHVIGLIAEYNPFHNGHLYQIKKIKEKYPDSIIIGVISSSFTQRGDISILNKWDKTKIALDNGLDIVIELPFVYSTQGADIFAKGAITILEKLKIDTLVFGTESESIDNIKSLAEIQINNKNYDKLVKKYLNTGVNYATALNKALKELTGQEINTPNDLLALSYIKKLLEDSSKIELLNIPRTTSYHGEDIKDNITSASYIRKLLKEGKDVSPFLPYSPCILLKTDINNIFNYLKYKIIIEEQRINKYQTVDEGIENRIIKAIDRVSSYDELITKVKTKRYTYSKISRMLLHILTNFTKEEASIINIDYLRLLGFTTKGRDYLNKIKKEIDIPIITSYQKNLSLTLDIELHISKIYSLLTGYDITKREYQKKPIIKK